MFIFLFCYFIRCDEIKCKFEQAKGYSTGSKVKEQDSTNCCLVTPCTTVFNFKSSQLLLLVNRFFFSVELKVFSSASTEENSGDINFQMLSIIFH